MQLTKILSLIVLIFGSLICQSQIIAGKKTRVKAQLLAAVQNNDLVALQKILTTRADLPDLINTRDNYGCTLLALAIKSGQSMKLVRELITKDADVNISDFDGWTPLMLALFYNSKHRVELVNLLLEKGPELYAIDVYKRNVLMHAAFAGDPRIMKTLLNAGAGVGVVDDQDYYGATALMHALNSASPNAVDIVRMLLEFGADPNIRNNCGNTALGVITCYQEDDLNYDTDDISLDNPYVAIINLLYAKGAIY